MGRNKNKTRSGRALNPADAYRKLQRKKEIKKNKIQRNKVRELILQTKNPDKIKQQIEEINKLEAAGQAEKRHKVKKKQLEDTLERVLARIKADQEKGISQPQVTVELNELGENSSSSSDEEDELAQSSSQTPNPQDSVYYHPTFNRYGTPPPGMPAKFHPPGTVRTNTLPSNNLPGPPGLPDIPAPPPGPPPSESQEEEEMPKPPPLPPPPLSEAEEKVDDIPPRPPGLPPEDNEVVPRPLFHQPSHLPPPWGIPSFPLQQNLFGLRGPLPIINQFPRPTQTPPPLQPLPIQSLQPHPPLHTHTQPIAKVISHQPEISLEHNTSMTVRQNIGPGLPSDSKKKLIPVALRVKRKNSAPSTAPLKKKKSDDGAASTSATEGLDDDAVDKFMEEMNALGALTS